MQPETETELQPAPPAPAPVVYRCEYCGAQMGHIDHDMLCVTSGGVVVARIANGDAVCPDCRRVKVWYMAEWRTLRLLRQRAKAQAVAAVIGQERAG